MWDIDAHIVSENLRQIAQSNRSPEEKAAAVRQLQIELRQALNPNQMDLSFLQPPE
jgi:hypothetical protein